MPPLDIIYLYLSVSGARFRVLCAAFVTHESRMEANYTHKNLIFKAEVRRIFGKMISLFSRFIPFGGGTFFISPVCLRPSDENRVL